MLALTASGKHAASSEAGQLFSLFPLHLCAVISFFALPVLHFEQLLSFEKQMKFLLPQLWLLYLKAQTRCQHWGSREHPVFITFSRKSFGKKFKTKQSKSFTDEVPNDINFPKGSGSSLGCESLKKVPFSFCRL